MRGLWVRLPPLALPLLSRDAGAHVSPRPCLALGEYLYMAQGLDVDLKEIVLVQQFVWAARDRPADTGDLAMTRPGCRVLRDAVAELEVE